MSDREPIEPLIPHPANPDRQQPPRVTATADPEGRPMAEQPQGDPPPPASPPPPDPGPRDPTTTTALALAVARADTAVTDRVAWVVEEIADRCCSPGSPEQPWTGRLAVVAAAMEEFACDEVEADRAVSLAVTELWSRGQESSAHVQRRLMRARLVTIREMIVAGLKKPRVTRTFFWKDTKRKDAQGKSILKRLPKREVINEGMDVNAVRLLIEVERAMAGLEDLDGASGNDELIAQIFDKIDEDADGRQTKSTGVSISQRIRRTDLAKLSPAAQAVIAKAVDQEQGRRRAVTSTDVTVTDADPA